MADARGARSVDAGLVGEAGSSEPSVRVHATGLLDLVQRIVEGLGARTVVAREVAEHLVGANLAGHDSHGVQRLRSYAREAAEGRLVPSAEPHLLDKSGAVLTWDAGRTFGHYSTWLACQSAADAAAEYGVGLCVIRQSTHIGRVGHYAERLAAQGLVSIITVGMAGDGVGAMLLPGSTRRFFGANPWTIGVPTGSGTNVIVDVSSAVAAEGKVQVARAAGADLAPGVIVDSAGRPSVKPSDYFEGGALLPLGGHEAGHKGYGLGLAAALLGALGCVGDPDPTMVGASVAPDADPRGRIAGVFVLVVNPAAVPGGINAYEGLVRETVNAIHRAGSDIVVPGEPEARTRSARNESFNLPSQTWADLRDLAASLGVDV